ncbi:DUF1376 domain-containing protein [Bartonella raoultii]|uniref:YdaU family protein n=1 Tax=Bartonella raoultii TaxID=1457020 RepID=A0ABS7I655_9HYPH|nr:DUF1376 domain-containing protein [Bartonella raoultii]MBX4336374.1 YdaU family protein [Bartonella raoultii]MBX4336559.1 YdaU family protein [Bartonella raoultii]
MSTKLPWTRLFSSQWIVDVSGMSIVEKGLYMTLVLYMYEERRPIIEDAPKLARWAGCSERILKKTLDILLRDEKIIRLKDGRLWSLKVEEELNNSNENLNKFSERAQKAAKARWDKDKSDNDVKNAKDASNNANSIEQAMLNDAINNNNNINIYNKKNKTIVLSKKEIDSENLETTDLVEEPIEGDDVQSEQIATSSENQPPIHEQENVLKKAKRVKTDRGCRLPADFEPDYDFALSEGLPPERVKVEIAKFRDYWRSKAGANAAKTDWQATWRNWVRNSKKYEINQQGKNYGNYTQKQKSIGERIADSLLDIGNRGYFEAHSRDDTTTGVPIGFEGWQPINKTAGSDCFRGC